MSRTTSRAARLATLTAALVASLGAVACGTPATGGTDPTAYEEGLPTGWSAASHGPDADVDYGMVLPAHAVRRIDLTIAASDWQAMQDDLTSMLGAFGAGGVPIGLPFDGGTVPGIDGNSSVPAEAFTACEGLTTGDACSVNFMGQVMPGVCGPPPSGGLACRPNSMGGDPGAAGGGGSAPDGGVGSPTVNPNGSIDLVARTPIYVPCTVRFEGREWWHVGLRYKGNSTLSMPWSAGNRKLPFRLDFDRFEDQHPLAKDQTFYGLRNLLLSNSARDASLLRDKVTADIQRAAGIGTPRAAFYRVYVDVGNGAAYFGLYTATEVPGAEFLAAEYGNQQGNLYKADGVGAHFAAFDAASFEKKSNAGAADWSDVQGVIAALNAPRADAAAWRAELAARFDVGGFLRWLAVNTLVQDWDTYGRMAHNFYLYGDRDQGGRLAWIPYDHNEAMSNMNALSLGLDEVSADWPLIRFLLDDEVFAAQYRDELASALHGAYDLARTQARMQAAHDLIAPYVVGAEGEQTGSTSLTSPAAFDQELQLLVQHAAQRQAAGRAFVGAQKP